MKSDNVNGLFAFAFGQSLSRTVSESAGNISFEIQRTLGFRGEVVVNWAIFRESGSRASGDFVQPTGSLLFAKEERKKVRSLLDWLSRPQILKISVQFQYIFHSHSVSDPHYLRVERQQT